MNKWEKETLDCEIHPDFNDDVKALFPNESFQGIRVNSRWKINLIREKQFSVLPRLHQHYDDGEITTSAFNFI